MPIEIKLRLERLAIELGITITGVHSVCLIDTNTVSAIFDVESDEAGCGLHFQFEKPDLVSKNDLRQFGEWLASPDYTGGMTMH